MINNINPPYPNTKYQINYADPEIGWHLVTHPTVLITLIAIGISLLLFAIKTKTKIKPKIEQIITITVLSLVSYAFIEFIQTNLWTYQPCYLDNPSFLCISTTLYKLIQFILPVCITGYLAIVLIPNLLSKSFGFTYKTAIIYLLGLYITFGFIFLIRLNQIKSLDMFIDYYQNDFTLGSIGFSLLTISIIIMTWPALLAIYLFT